MQARKKEATGADGGDASAARWRKRQRTQLSVVVCVRPLLAVEHGQPLAVQITPGEKRSLRSLLTLSSPGDPAQRSTFSLDKCYDASTPQCTLFRKEVSPVVNRVVAGADTSVLVLGVANADKPSKQRGQDVTAFCMTQLFEDANKSQRRFQISVSYVGVYKDRVCDLLATENPHALDFPTRQQPDGSFDVHGLTKKRVAKMPEFETLYSCSVAKQSAESSGSYSHSILTVYVCSKDQTNGDRRHSKLHFVVIPSDGDKLGSESNNARCYQSERSSSGLSTLEKSIEALNGKGAGRENSSVSRVSARDKKQMRLLQGCLGGSSHVVLLCNVTVAASTYQTTLQTLNLAVKAQDVAREIATEHLAPSRKPTSCPAPSAVDGKRPRTPSGSGAAITPSPSALTGSKKRSSEPHLPQKETSVDIMKERLLRWKEAKAKKNSTLTARSSLEQQHSRRGSSESRSSNNRRKPPAAAARAPADEGPKTEEKPRRVSAPPLKRPRLSESPSVSQVSASSPRPRMTGRSSAGGKENEEVAVPDIANAQLASAAAVEGKPVVVAKKLVTLAIELEKKQRFATAWSVFKRASHLLPEPNAKLADRLKRLELQCPAGVVQIPMQQTSTTVYMQQVLERDLMSVLNDGSEEDLVGLHAIGAKRATLLMEQRPFHQLEDLCKVPGMSANAIARLYEHHTTWQ